MGYLVLTHAPGRAAEAFEAMVADLTTQSEWTLALKAYALAVFVSGGAPPLVTPIIGLAGVGGVLVGRAFDRAATDRGETAMARLDGLADVDPLEACKVLVQGAWGDYAAVLVPRRVDPPVVLAAPMGALGVFSWRRDEVCLVGSGVPDGLAAPQRLAIDWTLVSDILAEPPRAGAAPPLSGLAWTPPGTCRHGPQGDNLTTLWSPAEFARRRARRPETRSADLAPVLVKVVDACVEAHAHGAERIFCEVSGGLDSSLVATTLATLGRQPVRLANFFRDQAEADERIYAQAVADQIGAPLTELARAPMTMSVESVAFCARSVQPNFNAVDIEYDLLLAGAFEAAQADVMFTGHGGDVVFLQIGAPELAADLLRGEPCEGGRLARLGDIARRTRRSVWSLAWQATTGRPGTGAAEQLISRTTVIRARAQGKGHPWMQDLWGLAPSKRLQVAGLVLSQRVFHETLRGEQLRLANPLLSQPVVEFSLSTPSPLLSSGEGERTLARQAFAHRLPAAIVQRRSKGDISVFFGKSLAASADFLRAFLLDGRLMQEGLLDRNALAAMLEPEALIWRDAYGQILAAAILEAWVRHWEGRIASGFAVPPGSSPKASRKNAKARA
ncbi:asparagine synthase-related protein [Caulobacter sp. X]|uniref:asparagine synthase-related protein n=1 Tax=Caulobacter sp. X TaxID=2048901 RepID=UPI000C15E306|nr:asparagine synthase C-terminal domain-containing protein [Caulobacter sp. X]PIB96932.1 asparagine synthase [Caulobacter sp. X]